MAFPGDRPIPVPIPVGKGEDPRYGAYPAIVTDINDPDAIGRVKVRITPEGGPPYEAWAPLVTMMAGNGRGTWFAPDVNDEVLVVFQGGDPRRPFVLGAMWNQKDRPPDHDAGNNRKLIRTRGVTLLFDDTAGQERCMIETAGGHRVIVQGGGAGLVIDDGSGSSIQLQNGNITIKGSAQVSIECAQLKIAASQVVVETGMAKFSGVVQCDTLIANSVVAQSYTPGAGNIS